MEDRRASTSLWYVHCISQQPFHTNDQVQCFLTLPALAYLTIGPLWSRLWRLNNVYAYLTIDFLFALLWFAAAIAVAVWNGNGISKGEKDQSKTKRDAYTLFPREDAAKLGCAAFAYGSESKCTVSKATVGFAVVIFLLFAATSYISVRAMLEFRRTGVQTILSQPGDRSGKEEMGSHETKDVWSTNTDDLNARMAADDRLQFGQSEEDREGLLSHQNSNESLAHPGRRTSYHSQMATAPAMYDANYAPSALSPTGVLGANAPGDMSGRVQFPEANYSALR